MLTKNEERMVALFEELVPISGKCDSLAGELIRAVNKIDYRYFNDGDEIGRGYGKETCNYCARFLMQFTNNEIRSLIRKMWRDECNYEDSLEELIGLVVDFVEAHPQLRETETEDMFDYYDEEEDVDDSDWDYNWDDEDEEEYY